jgi:AraC family transcriptional regulator
MTEQGAYGERIARQFGLGGPPTLTVQNIGRVRLAATRLRSQAATPRMTTRIEPESALIVVVQLRATSCHQLWLRGRPVSATRRAVEEGVSHIVDLRSQASWFLGSPFDCLHLYVPHVALAELAAELGRSRSDDFPVAPSAELADPVFTHFGRCFLEILEHPDQASRAFIDHLALALQAHLAQTYYSMPLVRHTDRGGLAPWQERRAKEMLLDGISSGVALEKVAAACQLSTHYFARAFRQSTGQPPYRWLLQRRIEVARGLLTQSSIDIAEIALRCGFSDQSHFTRVFSRMVGTSPGSWRRESRLTTAATRGQSSAGELVSGA